MISYLSALASNWPSWAVATLAALSLLLVMLQLLKPSAKVDKVSDKSASFRAFQRNYLLIYLIIQLADWLQGTNMYTLYLSYGVDTGTLFVTGFFTSGVCSAFVGPYIDRYGRKRACIVYCILEVIINTLEHFPNFGILLVGRILGGLSTALLFTAVESWMVTEHRNKGFPEDLLSNTFSLSAIGNGLVAVLAGLIAQVLMDEFGEIGPFQAAIALTVVALFLILYSWSENYGTPQRAKSETAVDASALRVIMKDKRILYTGLVQSLFEGAMYTFVYNWVPTLMTIFPEGQDFSNSQGLIFSCFMLSISIGGGLFAILEHSFRVEKFSVAVFALAAASMLVPVVSTDFAYVFAAFLVLEACVGTFFACSGTMRSMYIPEDKMSTIMNVFRVPLNVFVVIGTKLENYVSSSQVFFVCFLWFSAASLLQLLLSNTTRPLRVKKD